LPSKKAVSISMPRIRPDATPSRITTQSNGSELCLRVSHPSYQAPAWVKTPGLRTGGVGVVRFSAAANHSSEHARIREPRGLDIRSADVSRGTGRGKLWRTNAWGKCGLNIFWFNRYDRVGHDFWDNRMYKINTLFSWEVPKRT
jgi:hypothetical protein